MSIPDTGTHEIDQGQVVHRLGDAIARQIIAIAQYETLVGQLVQETTRLREEITQLRASPPGPDVNGHAPAPARSGVAV